METAPKSHHGPNLVALGSSVSPMPRQDSILQTTLLWQLLTCLPGKFDKEEELQHRHTRNLDLAGICLIFVLYVSIAYGLDAAEDLERDTSGKLRPIQTCVSQLLVSAMAVYNYYVETCVLPRGTKADQNDFHVTYGPFGRWVYLTHQTIGTLAVHSIVSLFAPFVSKQLAYGTYTATPVVGAAGVFVTVQYFNLVFPNSDHKNTCRVWAARGVRFGFIDSMRHVLPFLVALLDVFTKQRGILLATSPSVFGMTLTNFLYVLAFLGVIHVNHAITGFWPYSFMKELGSLQKWFVFAAVQGGLLSLCSLFLSFLPRLVAM